MHGRNGISVDNYDRSESPVYRLGHSAKIPRCKFLADRNGSVATRRRSGLSGWAVTQRRLAAILFADIVGYSRLMDEFEAETHPRLMSLFDEIVDPAVAAASGFLVKWTGDGFLARFESVRSAVECAVVIQQGAANREADRPAQKRLALRMGLHVGDIVIETRDIYGASVNLAARLQEFADPGGVAISTSVREQLGSNIKLPILSLGWVSLKNISSPVHVFEILALDIPDNQMHAPPPSSGNLGDGMMITPPAGG
jgi:class 3 adenylate cyclase